MSSKFMSSQSSAVVVALLGAGIALSVSPAYPQGVGGSATSHPSSSSRSGASSTASTSIATPLSKADEKLVVQLAQATMTQINSAKLAEEKSKNEQVKILAKKMMDDHIKALDELKQLALAKGVTLPNEVDRQQKLLENRLTSLSGEKFDKHYIEQVAERAHKDEQKLLSQTGSKAQDLDLKNYAKKILSIVESHQQLVRETSRSVEMGTHGKSGSGESGGGMGEKSAPTYGQ
jgi:putative membrane protein